MNARVCVQCGQPLTGRRDKRYCGRACLNTARFHPPLAAVSAAPPTDDSAQLVAACREQVSRAGWLGTWDGELLLVLARRLVAPGQSGAAIAALSRELRTVAQQVLADALAANDPIDELLTRRRQRVHD